MRARVKMNVRRQLGLLRPCMCTNITSRSILYNRSERLSCSGVNQERKCAQASEKEDEDEMPYMSKTRGQAVVEKLSHIPYEKQLEIKMNWINEVLMVKWFNVAWNHGTNRRRYDPNGSLFDWETHKFTFHVDQIIPSPVIKDFRNKDYYCIGPGLDGEDIKVGHWWRIKRNMRKVVREFLFCAKELHSEVAKLHEEMMRKSKVPIYNENDDIDGAWRYLMVRSNAEGHLMIGSIHRSSFHNSNPDNAERAKEELLNFYCHGPGRNLNYSSLVFQLAAKPHMNSDKAPFEVLSGEPHIYEKLKDFKFRISADTFFQTNTAAAEIMYDTITDMVDLNKDTTLIDLCCGVGSIGIYLSPYVKRVVGMDAVPQAVENASYNAQLNGIQNAVYGCGRVESSTTWQDLQFDPSEELVAVVNPSRGGLGRKVIVALRKFSQVKKVVYISCKPLGRAMYNFIELTGGETDILTGAPFKLTQIVPLDMFPHCKHFELLLAFER